MDLLNYLKKSLNILPTYTLAEVKKNKKKNWIVLDNYVLDITDFIPHHPAGEDIFLEHLGTDCSVIFDKVCHSNQAYELSMKYRIGIIKKY